MPELVRRGRVRVVPRVDSALADQFETDRGAFLHTLSEGGDVCAYLDEDFAKKLTPAKCAQLSRQTAQELQSLLPTDELEVSFWDYNGAIYAGRAARGLDLAGSRGLAAATRPLSSARRLAPTPVLSAAPPLRARAYS